MPEMEVDNLWDRCVLLEASSYNRYGRIIVSDMAREIPCIWVEDVTSAGGGTVDLQAVVAQVYVAEDISLSSILWHGRLADFPRDWPNQETFLTEVSNFHKVPSYDGRTFSRWCEVTRFRDQLPDQE